MPMATTKKGNDVKEIIGSSACGREALPVERGARPITCDQVAWMLNAIERYLPQPNHPRVSRAREMQKYALLYELMEVAHLHFEDVSAQHNGTPPDVQRFQFASKLDAMNKTANALGLEQINPAEERAIREQIRAAQAQGQASNALAHQAGVVAGDETTGGCTGSGAATGSA
jgi:hypothetical protein